MTQGQCIIYLRNKMRSCNYETTVKLNTLKWNTLYIKRHYKISETISHKLREDIFTQNTGERIVFII